MVARSLQEHLSSGDHLARLASHGQRLLQFQRLLEATLPETLRPHARIANFRLGKLFINAENAAVAAKIRQFGPRIANDLSVGGPQITQIEVKVQARNPSPVGAPHHRPTLPGESQQQRLNSLIGGLPPASPLKGALERLLKTIKA